jgi:hypothetical protein
MGTRSLMENEYEILETLGIALGMIARIKFSSLKRPEIGAVISYKEKPYTIESFVDHATPLESNISLKERMEQGIYDCLLKPIE